MKLRRRLTLLGALLAVLLAFGGQQAAVAGETRDRRGWGCVHLANVRVGLCLDDPLHLQDE